MALVQKEAEGIVLQGYIWFAIPQHAYQVAVGTEPHLQATPFCIQHWSSYIPLPDINGTCCLLADHQENGVLILSEVPIPPSVPSHWTWKPANLPDDWSHDDGEWTFALEAVMMGSVPIGRKDGVGHLLFEGEEVQLVRIHAHRTGASVFLWLCCEGWVRLGPFVFLKLIDNGFIDETGNLIAFKKGECWHTPGRFAACCWHSPLITSTGEHPHPGHG